LFPPFSVWDEHPLPTVVMFSLTPFTRPEPGYNVATMIPEDLFELMACPVCIQPLVRRANPEALECTQCHRVYPVRDGLAVMLIDQATIEPS
jgi:uncharacterized protein YbaR (Trm112 family)